MFEAEEEYLSSSLPLDVTSNSNGDISSDTFLLVENLLMLEEQEMENAATNNETGDLHDDYYYEDSYDKDNFFDDNRDETETESNEDDFFAENKEGEDLPEHMKDQYLEQFDKKMDSNMTLQEFEQSQFEVHGIVKTPKEDPEMVHKVLYDLDLEIQALKQYDPLRTESYRLAEAQSEEFVCNRAFRLMFLRSEKFDHKKAAARLLVFFDRKRSIWGADKLGKKITLDDFDEHDMETIRHGHLQLLPTRDHAGRSVIFNNLNQLQYHESINQLRTAYFLVMTALEDVETQKNGIVFVQYKVGEQKGLRPNRQLLWDGAQLQRGAPVQMAVHVCMQRQSLPFVRLIKYALEYQTSRRVRVHEGSQTECLYSLMSVGIPRYAVPLTASGEVTTNYHLDWLEKMNARANLYNSKTNNAQSMPVLLSDNSMPEKPSESGQDTLVPFGDGVPSTAIDTTEQETNLKQQQPQANPSLDTAPSSDTTGLVMIPSNGDILLGRGRRAQSHPGNLRLNLLLEEKLDEFNNAQGHKAKGVLVSEIISHVKEEFGARFLKRTENYGWELVGDREVRKKIAHDFRTIRGKLNKNNSSSSSSKVSQKDGKKRRTEVQQSSNKRGT